MTIKQQGGIFGRNPKFNDVEVDGVLDANVINTVDVNASNEITAKSQTITDTSGAVIRLSRNDPSLTTNDRIGGIEFYQNDPSGSGVGVVAGIFCENESSFSGLGSIVFKVGDASSYAEVARFKSSGNLALNNGNGIDFSATSGTGTSELFDDYEEGEVNLSTTDANVDIEGNYVKAGRMVTVTLAINPVSGDTTWATGDTITGLPYAAATTSSAAGGSYTGGQYYGGYMMTATTMRGRFYVSGTSLTIIDGFGTSTNYSASFTYISET